MVQPLFHALRAALICGLIAATAMGCGDSGEDSTSTAAPTQAGATTQEDVPSQEGTPAKAGAPTKAEIAKRRANAICYDAKLEREEVLRQLPRTSTGLTKYITSALPSVQTMIERIGELEVPTGDEEKVQAILSAFEAGIEEVEANPDPPTAAVAFAEADRLAENYGFVDCTI